MSTFASLQVRLLASPDSAKYLEITLDTILCWKVHVKKERRDIDIKFNKINYHSSLAIFNKLRLYKLFLRPVCTYEIQLWGGGSNSNILFIIQR